MIGVYFSGTGNTRHCVAKFLDYYGGEVAFSIENPEVLEAIKGADEILFAHPTHYSNIPKIVRDFIIENQAIFKGKKIFILATMGAFSGDGAGCSGRLFKKYGAEIIGGLHLKMPDCVGDVKALTRPLQKNQELVKSAEQKIIKAVNALKSGKPSQEGLNIFYHVAGLFGQRLWFYGKTQTYTDKLKIDKNLCIGCKKCVSLCPMKNLSLVDRKAQAGSQCTMCYRCVSNCPQKAITLIGKEVIEQSLIEKYIT